MSAPSSVDVLILGQGYTALLLATLLDRRGVTSLTVSTSTTDQLLVDIKGRTLSALPVFPVRGSWLTSVLGLDNGSLIIPEFRGNPGVPAASPRAGSFSEFSQAHSGPRGWTLGRKLFGLELMDRPLSELQQKVARHYPDGQAVDQRIGFVGGLSPYWTCVQRSNASHHVRGPAEEVDLPGRRIVARGLSVKYAVMVATVPFLKLARLVGPSVQARTVGAPTRFVYFISTSPVTPNRLVYDLALHSPVYRVFAPTSDVVAVQTSFDGLGTAPKLIAQRAEGLMNLNEGTLVPTEERRPLMPYPLDLEPEAARAAVLENAGRRRVIPFGRMALWRYLDLHELDWSILDDITEHI